MVVQDVINSAMRLCGALDPGEVPSASESTDAFNRLNDVLEQLQTKREYIYSVQPTTIALTDNKASYQVGPGGADFPANLRPIRIKGASVIPGGTTIELPLGIIGDKDYQAIEDKSAASIRPEKLYDDYGEPYSTLYLHPAPRGGASLKYWAWLPLGPFVTLQDVLVFPTGYAKLLQWMLAVDLAPDMKSPMDPAVVQIAQGIKNDIGAFNAQVLAGAYDETTTGQIPEVGSPAIAQGPPAPVAAPQQ